MRDRVLPLGLHLAERLGPAIGHEHRIVAEPVAAARRPDEMTEHLALEQPGLAVGPSETEHRYEVGARTGRNPAVPRRDFLAEPLHRQAEILARPRPTRRVDARRTAKAIDLEARVVGERRQSRSRRCRHGLELRVAGKGRLGFFRFGKAEITGRYGVEPIRLDQLLNLPDFTWIVACDDEPCAAA